MNFFHITFKQFCEVSHENQSSLSFYQNSWASIKFISKQCPEKEEVSSHYFTRSVTMQRSRFIWRHNRYVVWNQKSNRAFGEMSTFYLNVCSGASRGGLCVLILVCPSPGLVLDEWVRGSVDKSVVIGPVSRGTAQARAAAYYQYFLSPPLTLHYSILLNCSF